MEPPPSAAQAHGLQAFTEGSGLEAVPRAGALLGSPSRRLASPGAGAGQEGLAMRPGVRPRDGVVGVGRDGPREGEGEVMVGAGRGRAERIPEQDRGVLCHHFHSSGSGGLTRCKQARERQNRDTKEKVKLIIHR